MEKIILLEATGGTIAIIAILIAYTKAIKKKLKRYILRNDEVKKYVKEN